MGTGSSVSSSSSSFIYHIKNYADNDFGGNAAGGGVYLQSGALSVSGTSFDDVVAQGGDGGEVGGPLSINGAAGSAAGGAIVFYGGPIGASTFTNDVFQGDAARGGQGADGSPQASGQRRRPGRRSRPDDGDRLPVPHEPGPGRNRPDRGPAIRTASTLVVKDSTFTGNQAADSATGYFAGVVGGTIYSGALAYGGAGLSPRLTVSGSTFTGNTATGYSVDGGTIYADQISLSGSTFTGNQATALTGDLGGGVVGGGVILSFGFSITDSTFTANIAIGGTEYGDGDAGGEVQGGVIGTEFVTPGTSSSGLNTTIVDYTIIGSTFTGNQALGGNGANGGQDGGPGGDVWGGDINVPGWAELVDDKFSGTEAIAGDGGMVNPVTAAREAMCSAAALPSGIS